RICQQMIQRFPKDDGVANANQLAWSCVMAPVPELTGDRLVSLGQQAVARAGNPLDRAMTVGTLGSALYRAGRFQEAIKKLDESEKGGPVFDNWLFLAMAHHKLGHEEKARDYLDRASADLKKAQAGAARSDGHLPNWRRRTELEVLHAEATKTLAEKTP